MVGSRATRIDLYKSLARSVVIQSCLVSIVLVNKQLPNFNSIKKSETSLYVHIYLTSLIAYAHKANIRTDLVLF